MTRSKHAAGTTRCGRATSRSRTRNAAPHPVTHRQVSSEPDGIVRGGVEGRRTVKIGGRPAEFYSSPSRRRPTRPVHERLGARPDRIAAWAFALGILLILIAIATANI